ncbi:ABC transporter ATP-binding protein [Corynebacterium ulceribovis]|uniref:ATP-binding cassette domain-containing protein n=1 Tax=Corynebacterium ulceribovis TaxID=487732 RepID=UPI001FE1637F|nr:ABC transporter ATP-binding protein [Corynebacterium ulceribovis]
MLTISAVFIGAAVDSLLFDGNTGATSALIGAGVSALTAALCGGFAEAQPGYLAGREEKLWRRAVLSAAIAGEVKATPPGPRSGHPGQSPTPQESTSQETKEGILIDAATSCVAQTAGYRATFLTPTLGSFTSPLIILLLWALLIDAVSAGLLALFIVAVPLVIYWAGKLLRRSNAEYRRKEAHATHRYLEMLEGLGTLKVLGAMGKARDSFAASARTAMRELTRLLAQNQLMIVVNDAVFSILMSGTAIALVLYRLHDGAISPGDALAGVFVSVLLYEPIDRVGRTFYIGLGGRAHRDSLVAMVGEPDYRTADTCTSCRALQSAQDSTASAPLSVSLRNINVHIAGNHILRDITLDVAPGKHVAIVGPSGSGKSTLLRVLSGLQECDGQVLFNDQLTDCASRRGKVFLANQVPGIFSTTVADNLRVANPTASDKELQEALRSAHLWDEIADRPGALESSVGDRGSQLSGGQRRRLAIARAFLRPSQLVLLDEPTADLDRTTERLIHRSLAELTHGRTTITVAHRLDAVTDADMVIVLADGHVVASGTPEELKSSDGYFLNALRAESNSLTGRGQTDE